MTEGPNTVPSFHVDKNDDISRSSITINPTVVFEKLTSLKCGKHRGQIIGQLKILRSAQIIYVPPCPYLYKIIGEWYSATRLENSSHNTHKQKGQQN